MLWLQDNDGIAFLLMTFVHLAPALRFAPQHSSLPNNVLLEGHPERFRALLIMRLDSSGAVLRCAQQDAAWIAGLLVKAVKDLVVSGDGLLAQLAPLRKEPAPLY